MIEEIKAMIKDKEEMSEQTEEVEEVKEELSSQEPVEKVNHNPEAEPKEKCTFTHKNVTCLL